jgi:hypothetical protein
VNNFVDAMFFADALDKFGISNIALHEWCISDSGAVSILECVEDNDCAAC